MLTKFSFLEIKFLNNTGLDYLNALGTFFVSVLLLQIIEKVLIRKLKAITQKTTFRIDDFFISIIEKLIVPLLYFGSFYFAVQQLTLNPTLDKLISSLLIIVLTIQAARLMIALVIYILEAAWLRQVSEKETTQVSKSIITIVQVVIWGLALVFILDNLGFNVSAVVAGLGIGGVAVALAAQAILGDLFNYFVIFFDKPFKEGDFIIIGDYLGVIEHIGIKTTRIRSLGGEQIVFSNSDLTGSRVRNYKRMAERRISFQIGVTYQTTLEQLHQIPKVIRSIIEGVPGTRFDRCHFKEYGDFSLNIETIYYALTNDYNKYMDIQQEINLKIKESFGKEGIEFAYPTQMLYVAK